MPETHLECCTMAVEWWLKLAKECCSWKDSSLVRQVEFNVVILQDEVRGRLQVPENKGSPWMTAELILPLALAFSSPTWRRSYAECSVWAMWDLPLCTFGDKIIGDLRSIIKMDSNR